MTDRLLVWVFTATIFLNAALLFAVQPMFSRMVLPLFGGSPAVWTTCMLFFQTVLLAGYFYAHVAPRWLGLRKQALVHLALLLLSVLTLPIAIHASWTPAAHEYPVAALLMLLTVSLGIPFFLLSSGSPLLQKWFSHTRHSGASNPYFLYAASNLGSMLALLAYPALMEPRLRLVEQSAFWTRGYLGLLLLITACVILLRRAAPQRRRAGQAFPPALPVPPAESAAAAAIAPVQRLKWIALAFVPSSLLLGVTTFLTTDIAAVPMLWIIPLALYLLTFVMVFARRQFIEQRWILRLQPYVLLPLVINMAVGIRAWPGVFLPVHLAAFFVAALVCHGELARTRPHVRHLTEFYLWISVGGMLGGVFNVIVAPLIFHSVAEYPIALVLAALLRPPAGADNTARSRRLDVILPAGLGVLMLIVLLVYPASLDRIVLLVTGSVMAVVIFSFQHRPLRFGLGIGALLFAGSLTSPDGELLLLERSFFGVHRVEHDPQGYHLLSHGSTLHGAQSLDYLRRREPLTYFHASGPIGQAFSTLPRPARGRSVAIIGLGTGSMACYAQPADRFTFYEIDPVVERVARDRRYFSFLADCPAHVVLGDARLTLAGAPAHQYDLIILDAFSSDAIPMHLLTREAVALYLEKLAPGGAIAFHISNRHLELQPVVARIARDAGLVGRYRIHFPTPEQRKQWRAPSEWVLAAHDAAHLGEIADDPSWSALGENPRVGLWTDDFSNIVSIFKWRR